MKKLSILYHSGHGHTTNQASGIGSVDDVAAHLHGHRILAVREVCRSEQLR